MPCARTGARESVDDLAVRLTVAAATPARRGAWAGRAELAAATDALRVELARLGRSRSAAARRAGADLVVEAVAVLGRLAERASRVDSRRPMPTADELRARLDAIRAGRGDMRPDG